MVVGVVRVRLEVDPFCCILFGAFSSWTAGLEEAAAAAAEEEVVVLREMRPVVNICVPLWVYEKTGGMGGFGSRSIFLG